MKWSDLKYGWISETMISIRSLRLGRSRQGDDAAFRLLTGLRRGQDDALSDSCVTELLDDHFVCVETKLLRQTHSLTSADLKDFCCFHRDHPLK